MATSSRKARRPCRKRHPTHIQQIRPMDAYVRGQDDYVEVFHDGRSRIEPWGQGSKMAVLKDGRTVPVSRTGEARLRAVLGI
jgi:hypothetical protein